MTDILQISDTHTDGIPIESLMSEYGEEDVDAIVYTGDATQKPGVEPEQSLGLFEQSIGQAGELGEALDADVYFLPGNHDPVKSSFPGYDGFVDSVEEAYGEAKEDYDSEEDDFYEEILEENGVEDLRLDSAEVGDTTIVGGTHHHGPKQDWVPEYGVDELYEDEELEGIAEEESEVESTSPGWYDWLKSSPWDGFNGVVETVGELLGYEEERRIEVDPDDLSLEDVPEELRNERHEAYLEAKEQADAEWEEMHELKKDAIVEGIEDAEGEVIVFDHGLPHSGEMEEHPDLVTYEENGEEQEKIAGSEALREVFQEKGDEIEVFGGGHIHRPGRHEMYGVDVVNSARAVSHYSIEEDGYEVRQDPLPPAQNDGRAERAMTDEEAIQAIMDEEGVEEEQAEQILQLIRAQQAQAEDENDEAAA